MENYHYNDTIKIHNFIQYGKDCQIQINIETSNLSYTIFNDMEMIDNVNIHVDIFDVLYRYYYFKRNDYDCHDGEIFFDTIGVIDDIRELEKDKLKNKDLLTKAYNRYHFLNNYNKRSNNFCKI